MNETETEKTDKKIKIMTLSDHPLSPSGVGSQTKYVITSLLDTGRFQVLSFGGAIRHQDYTPVVTEQYGEDWKIVPVDGYGAAEAVRSVVRTYKPDIIWFMTDPRFWGWLWDIEHELRPLAPMVYYHVWDNYPYPKFNKMFYDSNDVICTISKVTDDIVRTVAPDVECIHMPHAVDTDIFKPIDEEHVVGFKKTNNMDTDRVIFFWNNRNARRKQSGTVLYWFNEFAEKVGPENVMLIMHTDPKDPNGQDLEKMLQDAGADDGRVLLSTNKISPHELAMMYNVADCTVNIADAEGFGLATLESLSCGTPIIVNMTGGLQEQVTDGKKFFGVGLEPASKAIIGSQGVPYIYEDRVSKEDFMAAITKIYEMSKEERVKLGKAGRKHVMKNYNFKDFCNNWVETLEGIHEKHGSWESRKGYKAWTLKEIK